MTNYQLRFIRRDDTSKRVIDLEFGSDKEARDFVVDNYPQRATELWVGDRRVSRRTSPKHEAQLRGWYPRVSIYPVLSCGEIDKIEAQYGQIANFEFALIGRTGMQVYHELGKRIRPHGVWYRAFNYPQPPSTVPQHAYFSFGISRQHECAWEGFSNCGIYSHVRDGAAILDDLISSIAESLLEAHENAGINFPEHPNNAHTYPPSGHVVRDGLHITGGAMRFWRLNRPVQPAA